MAEVKHTLDEIIRAIKGSSGIKLVIARSLGVHRNTVNNYLKKYVSAREAYIDEIEAVGDFAESVIIKSIKNEDVETAKWYARFKLKDRGYSERQEVTGADGGKIETKVTIDEISQSILDKLLPELAPSRETEAPGKPDSK